MRGYGWRRSWFNVMQTKCKQTGALTLLDIQARLDPCPLKNGSSSEHVLTIDNQRGDNLYELVITVSSYGKGIEFAGGPTEHRHEEKIVPAGISKYQTTIKPNNSKPAKAEEIITAIKFYDSTQNFPSGFFGNPEETTVKYTIAIQ